MCTDGSVNYVQSTIASDFFIPTDLYSWSGRLTETISSTTAELCALQEALVLPQCSRRQWLLATYSLCSELSLRGCTSANAYLSRDIVRLGAILVSKRADVRIQWISSHVGVHGNEKADCLALEALNYPVATVPVPSRQDRRDATALRIQRQHRWRAWLPVTVQHHGSPADFHISSRHCYTSYVQTVPTYE